MRQRNYLDKSQPFPVVRFPPRVVANCFEEILRQAYKKTLFEKVTRVEFDFSSVIWSDIFELSLTALWLAELKSCGKEVIFRFPRDSRMCQFLFTYRFDVFLSTQEIQKEDSPVKGSAAPTNLVRAPFYPLTFFDETGFRNLLTDLNYGNRLEVILNDVKSAEIVKSGVIRDVVLSELIDNLIIHGDARFGNLIMTKLGASSADRSDEWTNQVLNHVSEIEKPFFRKLNGRSFLALVIADKGVGITGNLREAYLSDPIMAASDKEPSDDQLVEYSFLYHSTRRPLSECNPPQFRSGH